MLSNLRQARVSDEVERLQLRDSIKACPEDFAPSKEELETLLRKYLAGLPRNRIPDSRALSGLEGRRRGKCFSHGGKQLNGSKSLQRDKTMRSKVPKSLFTSTAERFVYKTLLENPIPSTSSSQPSVEKRADTNRGSARMAPFLDFGTSSGNKLLNMSLSEGAITSAKLVDYVFLIGPSAFTIEKILAEDTIDRTSIQALLPPTMLFMERSSLNAELDLETIPYFCFPSGIPLQGELPRVTKDIFNSSSGERTSATGGISRSQTFVFCLQNNTTCRYAVCMVIPRTFYDRKSRFRYTTNYCLCLVTEYPYFSFLSYIMQRFDACGGIAFDSPIEEQVDGLILRDELQFLNQLFGKLKKQTVPGMGQQIYIKVSIRKRDLTFSMPRLYEHKLSEKDKEVAYHTMLWGLPTLLKCLPLDQILLLLGCALTEMRIIIVSPHLKEVSAAILSLLYLIKPLKWAGTVIITCPDAYILDFTESPVFFMIGVQQLPESYEQSAGTAILSTAKRMVLLHDDDVVTSNTLTMPQSNRLLKLLKPSYNAILSTAQVNILRFESGWQEYTSGIDLEVPADLNLTSEEGQSLRQAIGAFCQAVNEHVSAMVNTSIAQDRDAKLNMNDKRLSLIRGCDRAESESLASLTVDAGIPISGRVFALEELGSHAKAFLRHFLQTQMYSVFCVNALKSIVEVVAMDRGSSRPETNRSSARSASRFSPVSFRESVDDTAGGSQSTADTYSSPLTALFSVMFTGSRRLPPQTLDEIRTTYAEGIPPLQSLPGVSRACIDRHSQQDVSTPFICRGKCNGFANTAECSTLCVHLWADKVKCLRYQVAHYLLK